MSDTTLAFAIVPFLIALTLALECTRIGCQWLDGRVRRGRRAQTPTNQSAEADAEESNLTSVTAP